MSERALATTQKQSSVLAAPSHGGILQRKCACGNHIMAGGECAECSKTKLHLQRKLTIGASSDPLELEADRMAEAVATARFVATKPDTSPLSVQRQEVPLEKPREQTTQFRGQEAPKQGHAKLLDQSKLREPPKFAPSVVKPLFKREPGAGTIPDPQIVEAGLQSPGIPLDPATRDFMESRFGYDFSQVRIHTDPKAAESARALNAMAYTVGRDVVFGPGRYSPMTSSGTRLLAHELTHVVQQTGSESNLLGPTDGNRELSPISRNNPSPAPHFGATSGFLVQRAPPDAPDPGEEILGGTKSTSRTIVLYHYGDLEGRESFTSPQSYPRLTDCDIAASQEEAARYTGAPINQKLRYKYELKIDRDYFDKNFKNTGTRNGFSEFGTSQSIPAKFFRKVATLNVAPTGGGVPSGAPPGGSGGSGPPAAPAAATPAPQGDSPTYGSLSPRKPAPNAVSERVELKKAGGSWVEIAAGGEQKPANGTYSFALRDGRMYGSRYGHLEASGGGRVRFVGDIQFNNGTLERWDAGSGSYKPVESFVEEIATEAKKNGLDLEFDKDPQKSKFRPLAPEAKSGPRQLPVFQEKGDAKLTPAGKGAPTGAAPVPAGGGMQPSAAPPLSAVTQEMRAGARGIAQELGKSFRMMRVARVLTSILRVVEFAGNLLMVYQSISMAQHGLAGEGFILTDRIKESEDLRDKANALDAEYPAFSDWVQSMGFPIYVAAVDADSIESLLMDLSELGSLISEQGVDLRKQSKRVKTALKEVTAKRQAAKKILDDPVALAALDHGGSTMNAATVLAADMDLSRIESALMQTDSAWDSVIGKMNADIDFVAAWHGWLQDVGIARGKLKPTSTISVSEGELKELSKTQKP
jgi:hypothetical protein